ncbi:hypothetical protein M011DRAFT_486774 [Sporormia fimetaria CBS 119925]|uniref:Uncharacterized protein n=1 Tax=Sporormia fimetaria CBS 119925 TaxID=1340428 RepID=A0A6A6VAJ8_9PLEO|nr:hypothetical protein M011DRAFT_486774 [Sporormia fimetaria CBS 119925]
MPIHYKSDKDQKPKKPPPSPSKPKGKKTQQPPRKDSAIDTQSANDTYLNALHAQSLAEASANAPPPFPRRVLWYLKPVPGLLWRLVKRALRYCWARIVNWARQLWEARKRVFFFILWCLTVPLVDWCVTRVVKWWFEMLEREFGDRPWRLEEWVSEVDFQRVLWNFLLWWAARWAFVWWWGGKGKGGVVE